MINIQLSDLNRENLYGKVLQATEEICEEYNLNKEFGAISMANQMVIDYLLDSSFDISLEVSMNLDSDTLLYNYTSFMPLFTDLFDNRQVMKDEYHLLSLLADECEFSTDGKQLSLTFHVKPYMQANHILQTHSAQHKPISL